MVDFSTFTIPPRKVRITCSRCGETGRAPDGESVCETCLFHADHPELAPGYFTWTQTSAGWAAQAKWREGDPDPEPGACITVHRRDGTSSGHTVTALRHHYYDRAANRVVVVDIA